MPTHFVKTAVSRLLITYPLLLVLSSANPSAVRDAVATKKPASAPNLGEFFKQHYKDRVKSFREQNEKVPSKNVVFVGDSITEGFDLAKNFPNHHVLNRGISADVIGNALAKNDNRGILHRMDESIFDCSPSEVFILIGINDLGSGHKPEVIAAGYREILQGIKSHQPKLKVHVQSVLPTRDNYAKHNANVNDVNGRLQQLAKEFGYDYIDLHSQVADDKGELKKEFTRDGLHLNAEGYKIWKAQVDRTMGW